MLCVAALAGLVAPPVTDPGIIVPAAPLGMTPAPRVFTLRPVPMPCGEFVGNSPPEVVRPPTRPPLVVPFWVVLAGAVVRGSVRCGCKTAVGVAVVPVAAVVPVEVPG